MSGLRVKINRAPMERVRDAAQRFDITAGDMAGPVLVRVGQVHRRQEAEVFQSQGATSVVGRWAPLSPDYAKAKRAALGAGRASIAGLRLQGKERREAIRSVGRPISMAILVWSGDMRNRFVSKSSAYHIEDVGVLAPERYVIRLGAASKVAAYHAQLDAAGLGTLGVIASGFGAHLPRRDMVTKTPKQILELQVAIVDWYRNERVPQALRYLKGVGYIKGAGSIGRGPR